jgi:hypothetical protein
LVSLLDQTLPNRANWSVDESLAALRIDDQDRTLIAFGRTNEEPVDFEITLQQPGWPGEIGVFFGHGARETPPGHQYHLIQIMRLREGKYTLRAAVVEYHQADPHGNHNSHTFGEWPLNEFQHHGNVIRIQLDQGKPAGVWLNGQDLGPWYLSKWQKNVRPDESSCRGHFGAYSKRGPGVFLNAALNGERVLLRQ